MEPSTLDQILLKTSVKRDQCLVALLYLSGRRIMEILGLRKTDFNTNIPGRISFHTFNEKSFRQVRKAKYTVEKKGIFQYKDKKTGEVTEYYTRWYEAIEPEFSTTGPSGALLHHYITEHLEKTEDYLFKPDRASGRRFINQSRAYNIIRALDDRLWLHAMRHIDFTRMAEVYEDDPVGMHRRTFHKNFESTLQYIHKKKDEERLNKL